jgi:hypothetical protein
MDSVSPTVRTGISVQMQPADPCSNTFCKMVGNFDHHWSDRTEFTRVFRARPRYRRRVREYPQATGDGLVA